NLSSRALMLISTYPPSIHSLFLLFIRPQPTSPLFPYTTLFRSKSTSVRGPSSRALQSCGAARYVARPSKPHRLSFDREAPHQARSEEHTSELQSRGHLVCRLLLEKKKKVIETVQSETAEA